MNTKRILSVLLVTIAFAMPSFALTDNEAMEIAMELYKSGNSETTIASTLIQRGVSMEQLQKLQKLVLGASSSSDKTNIHTNSTIDASSLRTNNSAQDTTRQKDIVTNEKAQNASTASKSIFGHDLFSDNAKPFEPQVNIATPQDYILGTGDQLIINIYGASQLTLSETISPDGFITIDGIGPISLGGLTISNATRKLKATLGTRYQNSQFMLSLGQSRSISINVMGELKYPGSYQLSAFSNVLYALYMAGGITEKGTLRAIKVYRNNQLISTVDLYDYLINGATATNVRLEEGDVILVGTYTGLVQISGNVKRPMYYEMLPTETIHDLIYLAGGFANDAYTDAVRVQRRNSAEGLGVKTIANAEFADFRLTDGDAVEVEAILERPQNTLEIQGAVFRPGFYGLSGNLHTAKQLVETAQGVIEQAVPEHSVLYRMKADRTYEAIQLNLKDILLGTAPDMELNNEDRIFIPSCARQLDHFVVTIHGEVYAPGEYPYAENETVENLILRAGGLTDQASTSTVHVIRHLINPSATEEAESHTELFTISLNDSLQSQGFILEPNDEVYIRMTPAYAPNQSVYVRGEVVFEGQYALQTKQDHISSIIAAAGGLSQYAYAAGARLIRRMDDEEKMRRDQLLAMNRASNDKTEVDENKLEMGDYYYVAIDLLGAINRPGSAEDFILRDGDMLIIPTRSTTVKINGEVFYPNTVSFVPNKKARYYVNQAGGYSSLARKSKVYVIYANGKVLKASRAKIAPGCEIVVPSKPARNPMSATQWIGIASATGSLASVAASLATMIINATRK